MNSKQTKLTCQKDKFQLPENIIYLNCSYMSPLLKSVEIAGITGIRMKRDPSQVTVEDFFNDRDKLRNEYSRILNNPDPGKIAILPSVSYGMATVANNVHLSKGDNIVVAAEQFPSNYYPWHQLAADRGAEIKVIAAPENNVERGKAWNERLISAIDKKTKIAAIANIHWTDGTKFNLKEIREKTNEVDALLIVDGTQSVGAMPFDVQKIKPDALFCAAYKWLLGPYSTTLGYFGPYFDEGKPIEQNWINRKDSKDFTGLVNYRDEYQPLAARYDVGESSNFILIPMLLDAIRTLNRWGVENVESYCDNLLKAPLNLMQEKGLIIEDAVYRAKHMVGIRLPSHCKLDQVKQKFAENKIIVSVRGNSIRISPHVYNVEEDLFNLMACFD